MKISRGIILVLVMAAVVTLLAIPCFSAQKDEESVWTENGPRGPRPGPGLKSGLKSGERSGRGPGRGPGLESRPGEGPGRGPGFGPRRFELTEEEIDQIMKGLKESDPAKAKELAKLREKDPERFQAELRRHGGQQLGKIIRERIEAGRLQRRTEFLERLKKNFPKEAEDLTKLEQKDPDLYMRKYELALKKYGRIFEQAKRNPELGEVLVEDLKLQEKRDLLVRKIKAASNDNEKRQLAAQLEEIVGSRFDLIVRRKQIAYEQLLIWLEGLQNRVKESRADLTKSMDPEFKAQNVKERINNLIVSKFNWD